jgi:hypothetical protein
MASEIRQTSRGMVATVVKSLKRYLGGDKRIGGYNRRQNIRKQAAWRGGVKQSGGLRRPRKWVKGEATA